MVLKNPVRTLAFCINCKFPLKQPRRRKFLICRDFFLFLVQSCRREDYLKNKRCVPNKHRAGWEIQGNYLIVSTSIFEIKKNNKNKNDPFFQANITENSLLSGWQNTINVSNFLTWFVKRYRLI